jgi:hypothetical protein
MSASDSEFRLRTLVAGFFISIGPDSGDEDEFDAEPLPLESRAVVSVIVGSVATACIPCCAVQTSEVSH